MSDIANHPEPARVAASAGVILLCLWFPALAATPPSPNLEANIERPLRYRPDGADFVIHDGAEVFNRPVYGRGAFRMDGGDKPEMVLYLPGRGGNLRLGILTASGGKWLIDAAHIETRYRPGELIYEIRDPLLGGGKLTLEVLTLSRSDGVILRALRSGPAGADRRVELVAAYGGVNGQRGARDGDIGTEAVPISQWFQLQPEFCRGNRIAAFRGGFELASPVAQVVGVTSADAAVEVADARQWQDFRALLASAASPAQLPVALVRMPLRPGQSRYFALQRLRGGTAAATDLDAYRQVAAPAVAEDAAPISRLAAHGLARAFADAAAHAAAVRRQIVVQTPDPFLDAAVGALNVAADAVWDERAGVVLHGAIAWRARLLGWRGPYVMDALGWYERARRHFLFWAARQNLAPIPDALPPAEEASNLARNPAALHSNGDLSNSHYDMNLVYIDALFRHLLWTGDRDFARRTWPLIERHLAWERRLFRREFGAARLPLYEAYAAIWASDDLGYGGGGVAYASAYNWWHNTMAAKVARWLGEDAARYDTEAALIARGLREYLWLQDTGMFAEYRDFLGLQYAHPSAGLWSFYTPLDAPGLLTASEAWRMTRYVDRSLPHLPVRGAGVPAGSFVLATTDWMPYTWSTNNVVMGENAHAALAYWLADRPEEGFGLLKSALLASMYMGICPGNVGTLNYLDVYRRESQRDFADGMGVTARAIVEGLFGLRPDAMAGRIGIQPGFPAAWRRARLHTPSMDLDYRSTSGAARFAVAARLPGVRRAELRLALTYAGVRGVSVNGHAVPVRLSSDALGRRWLDIGWRLKPHNVVNVRWRGAQSQVAPADMDAAAGVSRLGARAATEAGAATASDEAAVQYENPAAARFAPVDLSAVFNDRVTEIFRPGKYRTPRSPYASLAIPAQGIGAWAGHVNATALIDDSGLRRAADRNGGRIVLPNGVPFASPGAGAAPNVVFTSQWDNYPGQVTVALSGRARRLFLLMAGSTNPMQSQLDNGEVLVEYADGSNTRLELRNPTNWWPIEQDYFIDDFQFRRPGAIPPRVDLASGEIRTPAAADFEGRGSNVVGGAATVLELPLDPVKELKSLSVAALANEVVIGLMAATLMR
jgi:Domain of unknown function (DUF4450)